MLPIAQFHPAIVHFPIAFVISLATFDMVATARGNAVLAKSGIANISVSIAVLAGVSAILAFVLGDLAYDIAVTSGVASGKLEMHEALGTWTAALVAVWAMVRGYLWWRGGTFGRRVNIAVLAVEAAAALLTITTAYFGGQLVYELGVNVLHSAGS